MSYDTQYHLTWNEDAPTLDEMAAKAAEIIEQAVPGSRQHQNAASYWRDTLTGRNSCKWYEHEAQMARLSQEWPQILMTLSGNGEDHQDVWMKYFLSGQVHAVTAEIVYPPFNPKLLREPLNL